MDQCQSRGKLLTAEIPCDTRLGGRFGYFLFFSARGRGRGSLGRQGGVFFLLKIPGGGGVCQEGGEGAGRVSAGSLGGRG